MKKILSVLSFLPVAVASCSCVTACSSSESSNPATAKNIVETAASDSSLKTLASAIKGAGLETTLQGPGPFTVLAPTDTAFQKLPSFLLTKLVSAPYKAELGLILKYHVLSGSVKASDLLGKTSNPATVQGGKLAVDGSGGKVVINGSINVTTPESQQATGSFTWSMACFFPLLSTQLLATTTEPPSFQLS